MCLQFFKKFQTSFPLMSQLMTFSLLAFPTVMCVWLGAPLGRGISVIQVLCKVDAKVGLNTWGTLLREMPLWEKTEELEKAERHQAAMQVTPQWGERVARMGRSILAGCHLGRIWQGFYQRSPMPPRNRPTFVFLLEIGEEQHNA